MLELVVSGHPLWVCGERLDELLADGRSATHRPASGHENALTSVTVYADLDVSVVGVSWERMRRRGTADPEAGVPRIRGVTAFGPSVGP